MERGGESIAPVPVPNRGSANVLRLIPGAREDGVHYRVEGLPRRFGQETDTSITLCNELAGLRRGKNQSAKELADSARRLASRAYHSNDYASQEKAALHVFQTAVGEDLQLKCAEQSCQTLEMAVETVKIQERYTKKSSPGSQAGGVRTGSVLEGHGGEARGPDGRDQGQPGAEKTVGGTLGKGPATEGRHGMSLMPPKRTLREEVPDQRH